MSTPINTRFDLKCDAHTHTLYSRHAYSTLEENVRAASECGLELLGTTDHFSNMLFSDYEDVRNYQYFINYRILPRRWHNVLLLRGVEADIVDLDGHLFGWDIACDHQITGTPLRRPTTLKNRVFENCDYVVASIHRKNFTLDATPKQNTQMYIEAMADEKVLIVGHPGRSGVNIDFYELCAAARDMHKLIEINEHSLIASDSRAKSFTRCVEIAKCCAELKTQIVVSSDAHVCPAIGSFDSAQAMLAEIEFPPELIATRSAESFLEALSCAGLCIS